MKHLIITYIIYLFSTCISAQTCDIFYEDYSSNAGWIFGDHSLFAPALSIGANSANPTFAFYSWADSRESRIWKSLNQPIQATDSWKAEFDFYPEETNPTKKEASGHMILALTEGDLDPRTQCNTNWNDCSLLMNRTETNQDGIMIRYGSESDTGGDPFFEIQIKDGTNLIKSKSSGIKINAPVLMVNYHVTLSKCGNVLTLSVSSSVLNASIQYAIPSSWNMSDLNYVQHANNPHGASTRMLSGHIDNLCIASYEAPELLGFNQSNSYTIDIYKCDEDETCAFIPVDYFDQNYVFTFSNSTLPGGAILTPTYSPLGFIFCWDPQPSDNSGLYSFQLSIFDDVCNNWILKTYYINVIDGYTLANSYDFCNNDPPVQLINPGSGNYRFGSPTGPILTNNILDPQNYSPGSYTLYYCPPDLNPEPIEGCDDCFPVPLNIYESPVIIFSEIVQEICEDELAVTFSANPLGGVWSGGPYISSNGVFDPAIAGPSLTGHPVTYTVTNQYPNINCSASATINVKVFPVASPIYNLPVDISWGNSVYFGPSNCTYELRGISNSSSIPYFPSTMFPVSLNGQMTWSDFVNATAAFQLPGPTFILDRYYSITKICNNQYGCPEEEHLIYHFVEANNDCSQNSVSLASTLVSTSSWLVYDFSPTLSNTNPVQWALTLGSSIGAASSGTVLSGGFGTPPSTIQMDFTSIFGPGLPIPNCNNYDICFRAEYQSSNYLGVNDVCETCISVPICDQLSGSRKANPGLSSGNEIIKQEFKVYPNPTNGEFNVEFEEIGSGNLSVYNFQGELITSKLISSDMNSTKLDLSEQSNGVYLIEFIQGDRIKRMRIVKN